MNFLIEGKCELSAYHYAIAMDTLLFTCANFVLTNLFIRRYWDNWLSAIFRYLGILFIFFFVGWILFYQTRLPQSEWLPPLDRKDSAILLPASCFLDPHINPYQFQNGTSRLNNTRRGKIGHPMKIPWGLPFYVLTTILFVIGFLKNILFACCHERGQKKDRFRSQYLSVWIIIYKVSVLILCGAVHAYSWFHITHLKTWVRNSGWIRPGESEDHWNEIGQLLPLFALGPTIFAFTDIFTCMDHSSKHMQRLYSGYAV